MMKKCNEIKVFLKYCPIAHRYMMIEKNKKKISSPKGFQKTMGNHGQLGNLANPGWIPQLLPKIVGNLWAIHGQCPTRMGRRIRDGGNHPTFHNFKGDISQ